jgi:hypothetical protein
MAFSDDTTIVDMAKSIGVADADVDVLSDRAKKLTRGDLLALWGTSDTDAAVNAWLNARQGELMSTPGAASDSAPTDITLADVASIQKLFDASRVRPAIAVKDIASLPEALPNADVKGINVDDLSDEFSISKCCCCPCCCATAVIEPAAHVA